MWDEHSSRVRVCSSNFEGLGLYRYSLELTWTPTFLRDCLWKFFLPADYQAMKVTEVAQPGKPRQIQAFELRMNIIADATIDLLFTKNRVSMALAHVCLSAVSFSVFLTNLCDLSSPYCSPCLCLYDLPCLSYLYWFMFYAFSNFHP